MPRLNRCDATKKIQGLKPFRAVLRGSRLEAKVSSLSGEYLNILLLLVLYTLQVGKLFGTKQCSSV